MKYFLRYTDTANEDLMRGNSINASDYNSSEFGKKDVAKMFDCDEDSIIDIDGKLCQILNGLCGYELESENIEDAIEEVKNNNRQFSFVGRPVIFSGHCASENNYVADGDLFTPAKIEIEL